MAGESEIETHIGSRINERFSEELCDALFILRFTRTIREAVQPFYRDVFGWTFKKFEGGPIEYWLVTTGDDKDSGINGGMARPREGQSSGTINTIAVSSLDETIKKIEQARGKMVFRKWRSRK